jgi:hypothetical protein
MIAIVNFSTCSEPSMQRRHFVGKLLHLDIFLHVRVILCLAPVRFFLRLKHPSLGSVIGNILRCICGFLGQVSRVGMTSLIYRKTSF